MRHPGAGTGWHSHWLVWALLFSLSGLFQLAGWMERLRFDRELLEQGDLLLLFSSQLVHLNWPHWALNMAGLGMIALLFGRYATSYYWGWVTVVSALAVGLGLWTLNPELRWYVGLSGALHGLMMAGILLEMRVNRFAGGFLLLLIVAKLVWEQLGGAMPGSERLIEGRVVVDSHLYGAIGGALAAGIHLLVARRKGLPSLRGEKESR